MTNLDSIVKSRDITLPTKVHIVKAIVFPIVMYGYERWTIKKAEGWKIDAFELWCWRTLKSPLDSKKIKPVNPKGNQTWIEYSLEGLILRLKLQYSDHLMWRVNSLEKTLMLGKIEGRRKRGQQRMRWLDGIIASMNMSLSKFREIVKEREAWHATVHEVTEVTWTWLSDDQTTVLCNSFSETGIIRYQNQAKIVMKTKALMRIDVKILNKTLASWLWPYIKKVIAQGQEGVYPRCTVLLTEKEQGDPGA